MLGANALVVIAALVTATVGAQSLPTVDLGYSLYQATENTTAPYPYYNFSNIRYGTPPTGNNRFTPSKLPSGKNSTVNNGQTSVVCPQAGPAWELTEEQFLAGTPLSQLMNMTTATSAAGLNLSSLPQPTPGTSEDCLFLDVMVPQSIYDARDTSATEECRNGTGAAVLVWIYGGGFTLGSKSGSGNPATLLASARKNNQEGVIFVAMNYRLGLYGWLAGPTYQANATANLGLYDQRLALEWVQKYIHLFGGDKNRVTIMGESAGGSSVMHQITAYGGLKGKGPFQQAILQSPGFLPQNSNNFLETTFQKTLQYASLVSGEAITTVQQLRGLSALQLYYTNVIAVGLAPYGFFTYGPAVDGLFAPKLPGELLLHGQFDKSLKVMVGHNLDEGLTFSSPFIQNETDFMTFIQTTAPDASAATINYVTQTLYPPVFNGSYGYTTQLERTALLVSEFSFTCNTRYVDTAYDLKTYSYYFTVPPGYHGEDISYTFFNGDETTLDDGSPVNATVANALQAYITSFAQTGNPNEAGAPFFPIYGTNSSTQVLTSGSGFGAQVTDTTANARCAYWQKALYI